MEPFDSNKPYCLRCKKYNLSMDEIEIRKPKEPLGRIDKMWPSDEEHAYHKGCGGRIGVGPRPDIGPKEG